MTNPARNDTGEPSHALVKVAWTLCRTFVALLSGTTLLTFFATRHWLADLLANLRIQQLLALLVVAGFCIAFRRWGWLTIMSICLSVHSIWILEAIPIINEKSSDTNQMTITLANVLTQNHRYNDIVSEVLSQAPDVIVILELSSSLAHVFETDLAATYPHQIIRPKDRDNFGIGLYSRHPMEDHDIFQLNTEIESISATVSVRGKSYRIFATHPLPPIGQRNYELRNEHLRELALKIREYTDRNPEMPAVLVGDLNLTPWSPHFQFFETQSGLRRASSRFIITPTWYRYPYFPFGLALDHALIDENLTCQRHTVGSEMGSDHRSVTVRLAPLPLAANGQP